MDELFEQSDPAEDVRTAGKARLLRRRERPHGDSFPGHIDAYVPFVTAHGVAEPTDRRVIRQLVVLTVLRQLTDQAKTQLNSQEYQVWMNCPF